MRLCQYACQKVIGKLFCNVKSCWQCLACGEIKTISSQALRGQTKLSYSHSHTRLSFKLITWLFISKLLHYYQLLYWKWQRNLTALLTCHVLFLCKSIFVSMRSLTLRQSAKMNSVREIKSICPSKTLERRRLWNQSAKKKFAHKFLKIVKNTVASKFQSIYCALPGVIYESSKQNETVTAWKATHTVMINDHKFPEMTWSVVFLVKNYILLDATSKIFSPYKTTVILTNTQTKNRL